MQMTGKLPALPGAARSAAEPGAPGAPAVGAWTGSKISPATAAIILTTALALGLRLLQLTKHGTLLGPTEYDDGVYLGSAIRLVNGVVPYRDFTLIQPPGIIWLMTPTALFAGPLGTAKALAIGRILTACAGAAGVTLTGLLIRHRGALAVTVACGFLAVYPDGVFAAHTVLLEPWLVLFCLAGALAVMNGDHLTTSWRRLAAGGAAFGFAGACKAWAIIPVLVLLAGLSGVPRRALTFAGWTVAGFAVPVLPFALLAPHTFYSSVVVAQLSRTAGPRVPLSFRLASMIGFSHGPNLDRAELLGVALALAAVAVGCSLLASLLSGRLPPPLEIFALATAAVTVLAFLWPSAYYYHYAAFLGPFLALSIVLPVSRLFAVMRSRPGAPVRAESASRSSYAYAMGLAAVIVLGLAALQARTLPNPDYIGVADAVVADEQIVPAGSCVLADAVSYTIAANRFVSSVPGCPVMVDSIGTDYALSKGRNGQTGADRVPAVRQAWMTAFTHAQYVWLSGRAPLRIAWTNALHTYFSVNFRPVHADASGTLYKRVGSAAGGGASG
jgi:hypothetical protein